MLSTYDFDIYKLITIDVLHEVELGLIKNVLVHLVHILHAVGDDAVVELDSRYELYSG